MAHSKSRYLGNFDCVPDYVPLAPFLHRSITMITLGMCTLAFAKRHMLGLMIHRKGGKAQLCLAAVLSLTSL